MTMKPRTRVRQKAGDKRPGEDAPAIESPAPSPLAFAMHVMQDEAQPMALRVSAAKLAASLLPKNGPADAAGAPGGEPDTASEAETWSDLELARRIAHILGLRHDELRRQELMAQGWDVEKRGMPMDNTPWGAFLKRIMDSL